MRERTLYISPRAALVATALVALSAVFMVSMPLSAVNLGILILFLYPFLLLLIAGVAGFVPAFGGVAILSFSMWVATRSVPTAALSALYLLAPVVTMMICVMRKQSFWRTVGFMAAAYVGTVMAIYVLLNAISSGQLAAWGAQAAVEGLTELPQRDYLLYLFLRSNMLQLDAQTVGTVFLESGNEWSFTQEALTELLNQVRTRVDLWLRGIVPSLISSMSIYLCVGGTAVSLFYGMRHAHRLNFRQDDAQLPTLFEHTQAPQFSSWYIPKQYGNALWILAAFYLLSRLSSNPTLFLAGGMMYNVFQAVYVLQGLSPVNSIQKTRGVQPRLRGLTIALLFMLVQPILMLAGLYDQVRDPRKLRSEERKDAQEPHDRRM